MSVYIYQNLRRERERDFMMRYCLAAWIDFDNHLFISSVIPVMGVIDTFCEIRYFNIGSNTNDSFENRNCYVGRNKKLKYLASYFYLNINTCIPKYHTRVCVSLKSFYYSRIEYFILAIEY